MPCTPDGNALNHEGMLSVCYLDDFRESFSRRLSTRVPAPAQEMGVWTSPRWGEAMVESTPLWTITRDVLFQKSP